MMNFNYCKYLWISLLVTILSFIALVYSISLFIIFLLKPELLKNDIVFYSLALMTGIFIACESYSNWIFKKLNFERERYFNNSIMLYKKHSNLCKKQTD